MDQNMPVMAKKIWHMVRVAFYMLRKGICKRKILMDLHLMTKRGKLAGKALSKLMFHHHHNHNHHATTSRGGDHDHSAATDEYEFSCSNTPVYRQYFPNKRKNNQQKKNQQIQIPTTPYEDAAESVDMEDVTKVLETMVSDNGSGSGSSVMASPLLPGLGFGRSPMPVRQLRVTDSPFPIQNTDTDSRVDQEAEAFIKRFYSLLKQQKDY